MNFYWNIKNRKAGGYVLCIIPLSEAHPLGNGLIHLHIIPHLKKEKKRREKKKKYTIEVTSEQVKNVFSAFISVLRYSAIRMNL